MNAPKDKILVIDDEIQIRRFLRITLEAEGFNVIEAESGRQGIQLCASRSPHLVVLDLGLPDMDGQQVLSEIRAWSGSPVIVLSVRAGEDEKVKALEGGADDYVTKPFGVAELVARIRVALRNRRQEEPVPPRIEVQGLKIDATHRRVSIQGHKIHLSRKEYELLLLLARNRGRVLTHAQILRALWGAGHERDTQYLRVYIAQLRQKLGDDPATPRFIATEPAVGYRFVAD